MSIRNAKLGGTDFQDGEVLYDYDLDDTFNAVQFEQKAVNNTPVSISVSDGADSIDTMSVSIPSVKVVKYILIKFYLSAFSTVTGEFHEHANTEFRLYKTYNGTNTDLIPTEEYTRAKLRNNAYPVRNTDRNTSVLEYYYEPTDDEKINGFDIHVEIIANTSYDNSNEPISNATSIITCKYINIMGV